MPDSCAFSKPESDAVRRGPRIVSDGDSSSLQRVVVERVQKVRAYALRRLHNHDGVHARESRTHESPESRGAKLEARAHTLFDDIKVSTS